MKTKFKYFIFLIIASSIILFTDCAFSQESSSDSLTSEKRSAIFKKIEQILSEYYPLPEVSKDMISYISKKQDNGDYKELTNIDDLTYTITEDLRKISNDYHIKVYPYEEIPDDLLNEKLLGEPDNNYGFQKVEIIPGNIGYLNLTEFNNPETAGTTAIAAMNFLANCSALIIDLRLNGGGDEAMTQLICSYFFDKSTHLTDSYSRKDSITKQSWTMEWVQGNRITEAPIYILISSLSYSCAELLAYELQQIGRAKIIGEKTKGGGTRRKIYEFS